MSQPSLSFDDIRPLFGLRLDAAEVVSFLARFPGGRIGKPSDGAQHVVFRDLGFDLLFEPPAGLQGGRAKHPRVLHCVFLFREGEERHREFRAPPAGFSFADTRDDLIRKFGEPVRSSLTEILKALAWDIWHVDGLEVHAMYDLSTMTTRTFTVSPAA